MSVALLHILRNACSMVCRGDKIIPDLSSIVSVFLINLSGEIRKKQVVVSVTFFSYSLWLWTWTVGTTLGSIVTLIKRVKDVHTCGREWKQNYSRGTCSVKEAG